MTGDHKGGIIGIETDVYYLVKKKNQVNYISDLCDLSENWVSFPAKDIIAWWNIFTSAEK